MRIITYNVNGIRAAIGKGLIDWLRTDPADVVCIQETKALRENIDPAPIHALGYQDFWFSASKKGYSGVAVFSRIKPKQVIQGHGFSQSDDEGRVLQLDFGNVFLINAYFPSGTSGDERQAYKYQWLDEMKQYIERLKASKKNIILCGDYNIAHREIDIHDPKGNKNTTGFLPEERAWMDGFYASGWVDTLRHLNPSPGLYTWWSQRFPTVRLQNKGWRIDYINVTDSLQQHIRSAAIYPDIKHSDHCPVYLELGI